MQKVTHSEYIAQKKPLAKQLLAKLNEKIPICIRAHHR